MDVWQQNCIFLSFPFFPRRIFVPFPPFPPKNYVWHVGAAKMWQSNFWFYFIFDKELMVFTVTKSALWLRNIHDDRCTDDELSVVRMTAFLKKNYQSPFLSRSYFFCFTLHFVVITHSLLTISPSFAYFFVFVSNTMCILCKTLLFLVY